MDQIILRRYDELASLLKEKNIKSLFIVCDSAFPYLNIKSWVEALPNKGIRTTLFSEFQPNPLYESVVEGVKLFHDSKADAIFAIGGGSAIDVAKCIKLYSNMDDSRNYLKQEIVPNDVLLIAMPTTAGTGSEATRYAVIYFNGEKQSVTSTSCIPSIVLMDSSALKTLPLYQKKATMLDALSHAIESYWSVNSTDESREYSKQAIEMVLRNMAGYLDAKDEACTSMLMAANIAGKAINITQTTAGHAMCYKLTSLFGIAHGHAAAICNRVLFPWVIENLDKCIDPRGQKQLQAALIGISSAMGCDTPNEAAAKLCKLVSGLGMSIPKATEEQYEVLIHSVNPVRLKNFPVAMDEQTINELYHQILTV